MPRRPALLGAAVALALLLAVACQDDRTVPSGVSVTPEPSRATLTVDVLAVSVAPASKSIAPGATVQLAATVYGRNYVVLTTPVTWSSSAPAIATVSATGLVTGVAPGSATIRATAGPKTGTSAITVTGSTPPPPPSPSILIAAGDIAQCGSSNDEATAAVVSAIGGTVATLGDNAYNSGTAAEYANCYAPSWGVFKNRTRPSVGNHEYKTTGAAGYFGYFGAAAGDPKKGYYSYDLGDWHVVVLNSNCGFVACSAGSPQEQWLRADLAATTKACVVAYWHHPRFNSGSGHGNNTAVAPFWNALYAAGAELILNGHEHLYERFAPQTPGGVANAASGIRQFTVGTGGRVFNTVGTVKPNSQVRNTTAPGVLKLTLGAGTYGWEFKPVAGQTFADAGTGSCH